MSSDRRLKRLGLDHLKNDRKALQAALDKVVQENEKKAREEEREQMEAIERKKGQRPASEDET